MLTMLVGTSLLHSFLIASTVLRYGVIGRARWKYHTRDLMVSIGRSRCSGKVSLSSSDRLCIIINAKRLYSSWTRSKLHAFTLLCIA